MNEWIYCTLPARIRDQDTPAAPPMGCSVTRKSSTSQHVLTRMYALHAAGVDVVHVSWVLLQTLTDTGRPYASRRSAVDRCPAQTRESATPDLVQTSAAPTTVSLHPTYGNLTSCLGVEGFPLR